MFTFRGWYWLHSQAKSRIGEEMPSQLYPLNKVRLYCWASVITRVPMFMTSYFYSGFYFHSKLKLNTNWVNLITIRLYLFCI
jgi:hypothetical protein